MKEDLTLRLKLARLETGSSTAQKDISDVKVNKSRIRLKELLINYNVN